MCQLLQLVQYYNEELTLGSSLLSDIASISWKDFDLLVLCGHPIHQGDKHLVSSVVFVSSLVYQQPEKMRSQNDQKYVTSALEKWL